MADQQKLKPASALLALAPEELLRYQVVSAVRAGLLAGKPLAESVKDACARLYPTGEGQLVKATVRSAYRWTRAFQKEGMAGLVSSPVAERPAARRLPQGLLDFFRAEKALDRHASVPELIRRAREREIVARDQPIDRSTAWRACKRLGLALRRVPGKYEGDMRRWAYPHRMMMVLSDGKQFRAGAGRTRRVALFFLDDATRYGLDVIVGTAESASLFLRGLFGVVERVGLMDSLFLDGGPGFKASDTAAACVRLNVNLIIGTAGYPEGHGKIEKLNQTAQGQVLRGLCGAHIDDDCGSLTLRLRHYLHEQYNRTPHESLDGQTPQARWERDGRALRVPETVAALRDCFTVSESRKVSNDNILPVDGVDYEPPRGHAGGQLTVYRRLLTGELLVLHDGELVTLHPVDLALNAASRRAKAANAPPEGDEGTPITAADLAFAKAYRPVVAGDGGFADPTPEPTTNPDDGEPP